MLTGQRETEEASLRSSDRIPTGVGGLDALIEGGFPNKSLVVLAGRPGTGKSLLATHFLNEGLIRGERSIHVSFVETQSQFLSNTTKFNFNFQRFIDSGTFEFLDLTTVSSEGVSDALNLVLSRVAETKAKRLVIDSFTAIAQAFEKIIDVRISLHVILGRLVREEGCTTLMLVEMPFGSDRIGLGIEEFVADGIILLDSLGHKGGPVRTISIKKMRGTRIRLDTSTYEISSDDGFVVFPAIEPSIQSGFGAKRLGTHITGFDELVHGGLL